MHRRWWINDPDCLLVRPDSGLTLDELQTVATTIALTGGSLFLSDDLPQLSAERLRIAQVLLPLIGKRPYILDWFDQPTPSLIQLDLAGSTGHWSLLAIFNWMDKPANKVLYLNQTYLDPGEKYLAREFWSGQHYWILQGQITLPELPPHGVCLLAIRPMRTHRPIYAGSNLHISQGLEVSEWKSDETSLQFRLERPGRAECMIDLLLPNPPRMATCNNNDLRWQTLEENYYQLSVKIKESAWISIHW
jgi:alpha-galactosidase